MKICVVLFLVSGALLARAGLNIVAADVPPIVFAGTPATLSLKVSNTGEDRQEQDYTTRTFVLSSSTAMPAGDSQPWKKVAVLGSQTILESLPITLPEVRTATTFRIEISAPGSATTRISVLGCPRDMLKRLADFRGEESVGVYDPNGKLKPVLAKADVPISDLDLSDAAAGFRGRVAILGPFTTQTVLPPEWKTIATKLANRGIGVVVLLPPSRVTPFPEVLKEGQVVVAHGLKWEDLETSASAQLRLLRLVELSTEKPTL